MTDRKRSAISGEFGVVVAAAVPFTSVSERRPAHAKAHPPGSPEALAELQRLLEEYPKTVGLQNVTDAWFELARAAVSACPALLDAASELDHMREARDNWRAEAKRLAGRIEAAKQIGLGTHLGRPWANVVNDMLRALDGKVLP